MKTNKIAIIDIATKRPMRCTIDYQTLEDLAESINEILCDLRNSEHLNATTVMLPSGEIYSWPEVSAHCCFDHGKISISDFVNEMFGKGVVL